MNQLVDKYGRKITYLRLAVTDRCNLRCQYCMPEKGIDIVKREELLTYKEMYRITRVLSELGVDKVRLTGGEPFKREKFFEITRRDVFPQVKQTYHDLLKSNLNLKLNVVIQSGVNTDEIIDFIELTQKDKVSVRFIEEMPFNGKGLREVKDVWNYNKILQTINAHYSDVENLVSRKSSTSKNFKIKGYKGSFGIIPAFTRTICTDCNRIRITATGLFKNCLFDDGVFNIKEFIRKGASDDDLKELFISTVQQKPKNGFIAEKNRGANSISESMSTIGG